MTRRGVFGGRRIGRAIGWLGLASALSALSCKARGTEQSASPETTRIQSFPQAATSGGDAGTLAHTLLETAAASPTELAAAWLDALGRRDISGLLAQTQYPFDLRDTGTTGRAGSHEIHLRATSAEEMQAIIQSLATDDVLDRTMKAGFMRRIDEFEGDHISSWAARWEADIRPDVRPLNVFYHNNEAVFDLILLVGTSGVRALWKTGVDASSEVTAATQWLQALRDHDTPLLQRLTSYPFELRDSELEANCRSRVASGPAELPSVLACLLDDALLNEALKSNFRLFAGRAPDEVPRPFESWRRPEHAGLWPATVGIRTDAGNAYELCFLVAKSGVRVLWKRGWFSPPD
jgi:hypothetical protein